MAQRPVVFISSTADDLREHREQAKAAALACGFAPEMMEYFPASGKPTLQACLEKVDEAEVLVLLVAHRYGWVPGDPSNVDQKSITWLEYERALQFDKGVLAFLIDPKYEWPPHLFESYRLVEERKREGDEFRRLHEEVNRNEKKLEEFKKELGGYLLAEFTDAASVRLRVSEALYAWRLRHFPVVRSEAVENPASYLRSLEEETRQIRIKGLKVKRAEPYWFGIDEVYIPLTTMTNQKTARVTPQQEILTTRVGLLEDDDTGRQRRIGIEEAVASRAVIIGGPGSGKSTFLRRVAFELCRNLRGSRPVGARSFLQPNDRRFPILIRVSELARFLALDTSPKPAQSPGWIPYFLSLSRF